MTNWWQDTALLRELLVIRRNPAALLRSLSEPIHYPNLLVFDGDAIATATMLAAYDHDSPYYLACADLEAGVGQRFAGATAFPPPIALSVIDDLSLARQMGQVTAREAKALGLNWLLAPVVDVQSNPANPVIDIRAFGHTPEVVSARISAFIAGARSEGVLTTAKHFPGHGDTAQDSHLVLPTVEHDRERLQQIEWPPFMAAIAAGVDAIMTAHIRVPALDPVYPATLSRAILTEILRDEWHYEGLIVTDALTMKALDPFGSPEAVAVQALAAGADLLVMPPQPESTLVAIQTALESGELDREQVLLSLQRIRRAKARVCEPDPHSPLHQLPELVTSAPLPPPPLTGLVSELITVPSQLQTLATPRPPQSLWEQIEQTVGTAAHQEIAQHIEATSLQWQNVAALPLKAPGLTWIWVDSLLQAPWLTPESPLLQAGEGLLLSDLLTPIDILRQSLAEAPRFTAHLFVQAGPFRGFVGVPPLVEQLLAANLERCQAIVTYGSSTFHRQITAHAPQLPAGHAFSRSAFTQVAIAKQLWGFEPVIPAPQPGF